MWPRRQSSRLASTVPSITACAYGTDPNSVCLASTALSQNVCAYGAKHHNLCPRRQTSHLVPTAPSQTVCAHGVKPTPLVSSPAPSATTESTRQTKPPPPTAPGDKTNHLRPRRQTRLSRVLHGTESTECASSVKPHRLRPRRQAQLPQHSCPPRHRAQSLRPRVKPNHLYPRSPATNQNACAHDAKPD